jgi:hypothetical protein
LGSVSIGPVIVDLDDPDQEIAAAQQIMLRFSNVKSGATESALR